MTRWHHAYNGVPTIRKRRRKGKVGFVGDYTPPGLDVIRPHQLSGQLHVSIKVVSPTIPGQRTTDGRVVVASRNGAEGGAANWDDVSIPVSTLKGVLSSAYEAVTASRMRVFAAHDHVLTHRRTAQEAASLYPVFLIPSPKVGEGTGLRARIMLGSNAKPKPGQWNQLSCLCAAVLPNSEKSRTALYDKAGRHMYSGATREIKRKYLGETKPEDVRERLSQLRDATPHGSKVTFTTQKERFHETQRLVLTTVGGKKFCGTVHGTNAPIGGPFTGYVVRLTPEGSEPLIDTKYNEFIFSDTKWNRTYLDVSEQVLTGLVEGIHSYLENIRALKRQETRRRKAGASDDSKIRRSDSPNTRLIHSILDASHGGPGISADRKTIKQYLRTLAAKGPGLPLFASISDTGTITGLSLSQVGRRVSSEAHSPTELAEVGGIAPARSHDQASPADRMWGFVADEKPEDHDQGAALRGRITIHPIVPAKQPKGDAWLKLPKNGSTDWNLPTLASPKPATGFPYLHTEDGETLPEETIRGDTYQKNHHLIRKVYPSHRRLIGKQIESVPGAAALTGAPDQSQTAVGSYLAPGATFTTTITFEGLTTEELAILIWLLTPECLVPDDESHSDARGHVVGYHRLGFGKPLGLGMVEIRVTDVVVHDGHSLAEMYRDLTGCLRHPSSDNDATVEERASDLRNSLPKGFESRLAVRAFVRASFGWSDGRPVQYPDANRATENDEISPITTWFKNREEDRVKHKMDRKPLDPGYALPGLVKPAASQTNRRRPNRRRRR